MFKKWFAPGPAKLAGRALYMVCSAHARTPAFYRDLAVPDTVEGRFELYALHVILVLDRLKAQGDAAKETGQELFDALLRGLDDGLREMGVGDLSVGKKMRKLGEALFGRGKNADEAFAALPDRAPLAALIARTVYAGVEGADPTILVNWVVEARSALADQTLEDLLAGKVSFSPVPASGEVVQ
jgi:cytochrome b pre-mRNA-processing protein 3